ncbi:P-loop NTPase [Metabacillus fastidiosus]|uniref:Mrp/NBP35 family ATP-binding protein n=1 Tax=Metabacillus fastidiosus TaxID=1458 RepID=UPI002DB89B78|nr:P-loop NTPase [Metabacillus fastidiosus]MEC2077391.1 P-loop NTPase [Metabacillus fastidiosus]
MLTETKIIDLLKGIRDYDLNRNIIETGGVRNIKISKGNNVSLQIALARTKTKEQTNIQQNIVSLLKNEGANSVGLKFEELSELEINELGGLQSIEYTGPALLNPDRSINFITLTSGKGGVGKSTAAINLAIALVRLGKKVGLIDTDIYGFSIPKMMAIKERPSVVEGRIYPVKSFGVKVISMGFFVEDNGPIIWRGPMLGKMIDQFFNNVEWGDVEYVILDLPPGTGDVALHLNKILPFRKDIIVTTPHQTAAFVAARAGKMTIKTENEILGIIENMSYIQEEEASEKKYVFGQGGGEYLARELNTDLLGQIPLSQPSVKEAALETSVYDENDYVGLIYNDIAEQILEKLI